MPSIQAKRKAIYVPRQVGETPKASEIVAHGRRFAVKCHSQELVKFRRSSLKPPFLARSNRIDMIEWSEKNGASLVDAAGDKAIFETHEDAVLCLIAFS